MITVKIDQKQIDNIVKNLKTNEKETLTACRLALKETATWGKSQAKKSISKATGLTQKFLDRRISILNFTTSLSSVINFSVRPVNLIRFKARQNKYGVTSRIMSVKSAFIVEGQGRYSKYKTVFKRTGEFRRMSKGRYTGKTREAIKPVNYDMTPLMNQSVETVSPQIMDIFFKKLQQKLKWQVEKRK